MCGVRLDRGRDLAAARARAPARRGGAPLIISRPGHWLVPRRKVFAMADKKRPASKPASKTRAPAKPARGKAAKAFTDEERDAMKERAREAKAAAGKGDGERDVLAKIAALQKPERALAERLHALIKATAPGLAPRTWY